MTLVDQILESTGARYARFYFAALHDLYVATVRNNRPAARDARLALAEVMADTMAAAELMGARMMLEAVDRGQQFAALPTPGIPGVNLQEATDDLIARAPVTLKDAATRTAQRIATLYSQDHVMAFVRSAEASVTSEAQKFIARSLVQGFTEGEAGQQLSMSVEQVRKRSQPWSESYSRMVFRTNVNTAITAGRFRISQDPDMKAVVPAFRFDAVGDSDTRHNHMAADGIILSVDNPAWNKIAPPLGYNCRCQVSHVTRYELEAMGRIRNGRVVESRVPSIAVADEGFRHGGRPDLGLM